MKQYVQPLHAFWQTRAPRERRFLAALGAFLAVALLADGLWSSHQARGRLRQQLPQLQQQLDTLQRRAVDIRALQAQPVNPTAPENALLQTATTLVRNAGLNPGPGQLQAEGPRRLRLRGDLPFDRWLEAVAALQRGAQLRLVQCKVEAVAGTAGQVRIDALFALPDPA